MVRLYILISLLLLQLLGAVEISTKEKSTLNDLAQELDYEAQQRDETQELAGAQDSLAQESLEDAVGSVKVTFGGPQTGMGDAYVAPTDGQTQRLPARTPLQWQALRKEESSDEIFVPPPIRVTTPPPLTEASILAEERAYDEATQEKSGPRSHVTDVDEAPYKDEQEDMEGPSVVNPPVVLPRRFESAYKAILAKAQSTSSASASTDPAFSASVPAKAVTSGSDEYMNFLSERLAAMQHENDELHHQLAKEKVNEAIPQAKIQKLEAELQSLPMLSQKVRELEAEDAQKDEEIASLRRTQKAADVAMQNMTMDAVVRTKELRLLRRSHARKEKEIHKLQNELTNSTRTSKELSQEYSKLQDSLKTEEKKLSKETHALLSEAARVKSAHQQIQELRKAKQLEDMQLKRVEDNASSTAHRLQDEVSRNSALGRHVAYLMTRLLAESRQTSDLSFQASNLTAMLNASHGTIMQLSHQMLGMQKKIQLMQKQIMLLRRRIKEGDDARKAMGETMNRENSELKQLRGSMPWLQAKAAAAHKAQENATYQALRATESRDAARAELADAQHRLSLLEEQYASVVQVLGTALGKEDKARKKEGAAMGADETDNDAQSKDDTATDIAADNDSSQTTAGQVLLSQKIAKSDDTDELVHALSQGLQDFA